MEKGRKDTTKGDIGQASMDGLPGTPGKDELKGDVGPMGPPGIGSKNVTLEEILNSIDSVKGDRGEAGPPGPAQIIQMDGGGRENMIVKGEKGDRGRRGKRGRPGPQGPAGEIGIPGWPVRRK